MPLGRIVITGQKLLRPWLLRDTAPIAQLPGRTGFLVWSALI